MKSHGNPGCLSSPDCTECEGSIILHYILYSIYRILDMDIHTCSIYLQLSICRYLCIYIYIYKSICELFICIFTFICISIIYCQSGGCMLPITSWQDQEFGHGQSHNPEITWNNKEITKTEPLTYCWWLRYPAKHLPISTPVFTGGFDTSQAVFG